MDEKLVAQLIAIPGAVGAVVWVFKRGVALILEQERKIRKLEQDHLIGKLADLENRLQHVNIVIQDKHLPEMERLRETMVRNSLRMDSMGDSLNKHGAIIELALPSIRTEIGKLSMYWKQTKEKP